ncbi:hypothetical protein [Anaeromyxobacter paludicola]|uniref:Tetratricopeptide repeat protein n=1 Tax=Anaeromyxobacter paludicola TaxID=2918171 RepID=A0ABM7X7L0_9BACT|nr:hypothetical protein [Anaeromyxobacter paludicola]BDG07831.1 hypothetical protein AMPC_09440 [Anaeromyxobacter paludicola]
MSWLVLALACAAAAAAILVREQLRRRREQAKAYLKGVRSMLEGNPDAAMEALSDAARLAAPEAYDTYLALGALFRREGDLARAIRLHRNILLRADLAPERRDEVERELAADYRRGGMLEEAEATFRPLVERGDGAAAAGLRDVLVDRGDLTGAAELQRRLAEGGEDRLLAHLEAALARRALSRGAPARAHAEQAVAAGPGSADALLALAEVEAGEGRAEQALSLAARALDAAPEAALLAWPALAAAGPAALPFVEARLAARPADAALWVLRARLLLAAGRQAEALPCLAGALERDGTGEVTIAMRELLREAAAPAPDELAARHDLMRAALLRRAQPLRCRSCGAATPLRAWRCDRCGAFDAF